MHLMKHSLRPRIKRLFYWNRGLYFRYDVAETDFANQYILNDENHPEDWHCKEESAVFIKFSPHFWDKTDVYYDGHIVKSFTVLGIEIGRYYSYDSRPVVEWTPEDHHDWREANF